MQEKTKEMDGALTNNMEEYRTQKKAREKRLMAYAEEHWCDVKGTFQG